jgi:hypothetical protein
MSLRDEEPSQEEVLISSYHQKTARGRFYSVTPATPATPELLSLSDRQMAGPNRASLSRKLEPIERVAHSEWQKARWWLDRVLRAI